MKWISRAGAWARDCRASVVSTGGKYVYNDDQETPNTQFARFDYGNAELIFDVHGLITDQAGALPFAGRNCVGNVFYGADGFMSLDDDGYQIYKGEKREQVANIKAGEKDTTALHMENFAKAVRSRNYKDLTADVEIGVISADLCHLANISYRLSSAWTSIPQPKNSGTMQMRIRC